LAREEAILAEAERREKAKLAEEGHGSNKNVNKSSTGDPLTSKLQNAFRAKVLQREA
jgi:hypothetical protein